MFRHFKAKINGEYFRVSSGVQMEADAVSEALPFFLIDNFNPGDVMNRVLSELLAVHQQRPRILLIVIAEVHQRQSILIW